MDLKFEVTDSKYSNIKEVLRAELKISSRLYLKLKRGNKIYLNGKANYINSAISTGDIVEVDLNFEEDNSNILPLKMNLDIIYEDNYILAINKPAGITIHPSLRHFENSLSNGVKYYFDTINLNRKIRAVNRLDKDTSGIVIFAKNEYIQESLILQMRSGSLKKEYLGILDGILENKSGTINAPISRKDGSIIERCIDINGQESITHYNVIKTVSNMTITHFILETGRTHQIRVHAKYIRSSNCSEIHFMDYLILLFQGKHYIVIN